MSTNTMSSTIIPLKCYTMTRQPLMCKDLQVRNNRKNVFTIAYSSTGALLDTSPSLRIHEGGLNGGMLCTAVKGKDKSKGFEVRLPSHGDVKSLHRSFPIEYRENEFSLNLSNTITVTWVPAIEGEITVPTTYMQSAEQAAATRRGDWKLVSRRIDAFTGELHEKLLAVYVLTGRSRKVLQKARLYFFVELGSELEIGAVAALMGVKKWHKVKAGGLDNRRSWVGSSFDQGPGQVA